MSVGVDVKIEALRARFAAKLFTDIDGNTYASLGRSFIVNDVEGNTPKLQTASTTEYVDVLPNDNINGHSFFLVDPEVLKSEDGYTATVGIYFAVDLDVLYPAVTERAVEYLHRDVIKQIDNYSFEVTQIVTGIEAFSDFELTKDSDNLEPWYLVRFDTEIEYKLNCNN